MKIQYFNDTDTLLLTFAEGAAAETRELDENAYIDLDESGSLLYLTLEHAKERTDVKNLQIVSFF